MKIELEQDSNAWLEWRSNGIGASDSPVLIMKERHPYLTPQKLLELKLGLRKFESNPAMEKGKKWEPILRDWFNDKHNKVFVPACYEMSGAYTIVKASLDGICGDEILEIKYNKAVYHEMARCGSIPEIHRIQIQHQLLVTGASKAYYLSYNEKQGTKYVVEEMPDEKTQEEIIEECVKFYQLMQGNGNPILTNKDPVKAPESMQALLALYSMDLEMRDDAIERLKRTKNALAEMAPHSYVKGFGWSMQKVTRTTTRYSEIPELDNIDLTKYRTESEPFWTLKRDK